MYRYTLQPYNGPGSRYQCPQCQHRNKTFTRYIDTETGEQLHDDVGRCDREVHCGYHAKPKDYLMHNGSQVKAYNHYVQKPKPTPISNEQSCLQPVWMANTMNGPEVDNFTAYLYKTFGYEESERLKSVYNIGISNHWPGATIFWYVDSKHLLRTGKVMLYDVDTGKRVKQPFNHVTWMHSLLLKRRGELIKQKGARTIYRPADMPEIATLPPVNFVLKQCLFGEHLLPLFPNTPVALCESEKTAIIAFHYFPDYLWLATGGLNNLNAEKCRVLKNRKVMLFPDVNAYDLWKIKADDLKRQYPGMQIGVSNLLERKADAYDRVNGLDIADVLRTLPSQNQNNFIFGADRSIDPF